MVLPRASVVNGMKATKPSMATLETTRRGLSVSSVDTNWWFRHQ